MHRTFAVAVAVAAVTAMGVGCRGALRSPPATFSSSAAQFAQNLFKFARKLRFGIERRVFFPMLFLTNLN
ncbi:MAG: hypothetical protein K6T74_14975 [Geminicoccaceae bacterium]|nr:hypothetical protein [Geminicoccaceae bacterium]